jgi:hypothetical protein
MPGEYEPLISTCRLRRPRIRPYLWLGLVCALASTALRADLALTNYTASRPLKVMASGDSITDDSSINGAWRSYLQPLLQTNGYTFTNLGRWISTTTPTFTLTRHEGMDGAVIAYPGLPPAGVWQTVAGPYPLSNGCFGRSVPTTNGPQQFFRLRKPLP